MYQPDREAIEEIRATLKESFSQSIDYLVPWFYSSMPDYYYASTSREERVRHLHAILTNRVMDEKQTAILTNEEGSRITFITAAGRPHLFAELCREIDEKEIHEAEITTSTDRLLLLATFSVTDPPGCGADDPQAEKRIPGIVKTGRGEKIAADEVRTFLRRTRPSYLSKSTDERVARHVALVRRMDDARDCHAMVMEFDNTAYKETTRISLGLYIRNRTDFLRRVGEALESLGVRILRGYADSFGMRGNENAFVVGLYVVGADGRQIPRGSKLQKRVERSLRALCWTPESRLTALTQEGGFLLDEVGFLGAACEYVHQMLSRQNRYIYSLENCMGALRKYPEIARRLCAFFAARFAPDGGKDRTRAARRAETAVTKAMEEVTDPLDAEILATMRAFVGRILKTNYFVADKMGLAFRMDPASLDERHYPERPFGYFYFFGAYHKGFQVRFRDMARGGVRIVITRNREHHALESSRLFDEVYGLAVAQQLKNKDIPEGGSKCVILLDVDGDRDAAVRASIDALLDVILADEKGHLLRKEVIDYYGREEIIYLGPDENMTPPLIEWIVARAAVRGYRYANAFMSSKPGAGINHKEYGVTSEGVVVYLDRVLQHMGIDPRKQDFTVKMTGGPDGDVAGNAIRILQREYGKHARVVAVSDGSGSAHDPDGLDPKELLRLFENALPIASFAPGKLGRSKKAFVLDAAGKNSRVRDTLHNVVEADVFIPAGGRPNTMHDGNWRDFLKTDGTPSAKAIVEGANIFLTPGARRELEQAGVIIIKDSSANKCGVICSSYEVLSNLVVNEKEFLRLKEEFVRQVIAILHQRAASEAELLLAEWEKSGRHKSLIDLSMEISKEINLVTDRVVEMLFGPDEDPGRDPLYAKLIRDYCPPVLVERYGERIPRRIPRPHQVALIAARIASKIVYQEGLGWMTDAMMRRLPELVHAYLEQERVAAECMEEIAGSNLPHKEEVLVVLREAALRTLIRRKTGMG